MTIVNRLLIAFSFLGMIGLGAMAMSNPVIENAYTISVLCMAPIAIHIGWDIYDKK